MSLASVKSRLVLPFWYRLTQVVLEKRPLNGCSSCSSFIAEYRSVQIPNYRQVQFASAPGQSVSSVWYTQSNCLPNHPSLITFLANSMSYSKLRHSSRSALIKGVRNFLQECISRVLPRGRGTSHGPVSVRLSVTSRSSTKTAKRIELVLARELPSIRPALC